MYPTFFKHILNPLFEKVIKRRKMLDYRDFLEQSQWWTRDKLLDFQWQELKKLLAHADTQVPYWKNIFAELKMTPENIRSYEDFLKLPIITKDDIRANHPQMIAKNFLGKTWRKATGGSTGAPLQLDYTPESFDWRVAISKRGYGWTGCEDGMRQAWIWGVDIGDPTLFKRFKVSLHRWIFNMRYYNSFKFDDRQMRICLNSINQFKPEIIVGYTNPLYNFAYFVDQHDGIRFQPKSVIAASEKFHEYHREKLSQVFGCPVFNTYGCREFMLIAAECSEQKGLHLSVENLYIEIIREDGVSARPGEMGYVVITDLHNFGMPFVRYKIGDMAIASDRTCACGRGLPLIEDVVGRSMDMIRTLDGKVIPGIYFPHLMKEFKGVKQFQVIQDALDKLMIKIVRTPDLKESDFETMKKEIFKIMGTKIQIDFQFVADIPLTQTGKYRVTVSNLK